MKNKKPVVKAIILAAGYSKRMKLKVPKQFIRINKHPLLTYSLNALERASSIQSVILVMHKKFIPQAHTLIRKYGYQKIEQVVIGGPTRQASVYNALKALSDCNYVLIHDGVRPLLSQKIILNTVKAVTQFALVSCAVRATDTIVESKGAVIDSVLSRRKLWHLQTPQAFRLDLILSAHQQARKRGIFNASDDAQLLVGLGKKVKLIPGSYKNVKITTRADLLMFKK